MEVSIAPFAAFWGLWSSRFTDVNLVNRLKIIERQGGLIGMLFFAYAVIYGGQFNSYYFIADFGCSAKKLAEIPQRALRN